MNTKLKLFLMAIVGALVSTLTTLEVFNLWYVVITTVVFALTYWVKNFFLPSDSNEGVANWKDIVSGLIVAVCMALSNLAATLLTGVEFSGKIFAATVIGAVVGYFTKTVPQGIKK